MQPGPRDTVDTGTAVILAAGLGRRLAPHGDDLPKGLLVVGREPLLARSLAAIAGAGIRDVVVVTGYRAELIESELPAPRPDMRLRFIRNPEFAVTGSMMSLLAAAPDIAGRDFVLLESDLLYHPEFVHRAAGAAGDVLLAADLSGSGDEVYLVADPDGQLRFLGKRPPPEWRARSLAELAGISRITAGLFARFCERAFACVARGAPDRHYEEVLYELAQDGWPVRVEHCPGLPWTEIDTPADLERARRDVWPRLIAAETGGRAAR